MNFDYTEDQRALRDLCQRLGGDFDDQYWNAIDQEHRHPFEFWNLLAEQGLMPGILIVCNWRRPRNTRSCYR